MPYRERGRYTRWLGRWRKARIAAGTLLALEKKGLHPRNWLGAARAEEDSPLLLMEA